MCSLLVCIFCALLFNTAESKEPVAARGKIKLTVESVETNCDHDYVEYFKRVPNKAELYTFRVVKLAPKFTISVIMRTVRSQRVMYHIKDLDGCLFLNNPFIVRGLNGVYNTLIVNSSFFKCPILPKVYHLKNIAKALLAPPVHPAGHYQAIVRLHMTESKAPFIMEIIWKYNVIQTK